MIRIFFTTLLMVMMTAASVLAEVAREITWDDLVPPAQPLEEPFAHLTQNQRYDFQDLVYLLEFQEQNLLSEVSAEAEEAVELTHSLESQGLDVESLLAKYELVKAEIARRYEAVVEDLEGQFVRLPGYALPLEFSESGVNEFLLVPYVGACIHVPPPPRNQTVFVRLNDTFKVDDLYEPVWVVGRMTLTSTTKELSFVDGQADVAVGYTLNGTKIEPYEE